MTVLTSLGLAGVVRKAATPKVSSLVADSAWGLLCLGAALAGSPWGEWLTWRMPFPPSRSCGSVPRPASLLCIPFPQQVASCGWHTGPLSQCPRPHQGRMGLPLSNCASLFPQDFLIFISLPPLPQVPSPFIFWERGTQDGQILNPSLSSRTLPLPS